MKNRSTLVILLSLLLSITVGILNPITVKASRYSEIAVILDGNIRNE